jgi:TolB protein
MINSDGSGDTYYYFGADEPAWSPDGSKIAFHYNGIEVIDVPYVCCDDFDQIITYHLTTDGWHANWSPDGTKIAFMRYTRGEGSPAGIWFMNADGSNQVRLTTNPDLIYGYDADPAWSPDGSRIVFSRHEGNSASDLYTVNTDGTGLTNITNTPNSYEWSPDWQPLLGPQRRDYKNAAHFCKALREFLGDEAFRNRYGAGANAHGKCVSGDGR